MRSMRQRFEIPGRLMGLNEYTNACRGHWANGARAKREQMEIVQAAIRGAGLVPIKGAIEIGISWIEGRSTNGKLRDVDNIYFGAKFILDALVAEKIIPNDSPRVVRNLHHHPAFNAANPHIEVLLMDYKPEGRTVEYLPITGLEE